MIYSELLELKESITAKNPCHISTRDLDDVISSVRCNGVVVEALNVFNLKIVDVVVALDFKKQQHLILPF